MFMETSAKAGFNVKALFRKIASVLPGMENVPEPTNMQMVDIKLNSNTETTTSESNQTQRCRC
jgi:Ras-related protein Rab-6A